MDAITKIFGKLSGLKKSAEFEDVIPELNDQLETAEITGEDLKLKLEAVIFEQPDRLPVIRAELAQNAADQEALRLAITGAERRQQDAVKAEAEAQLEYRVNEVRKDQHALLANYVDLDKHLAAAAKLLFKIRAQEHALQNSNHVVGERNRRDLIVRSPWWHLSQLFGHGGHAEEYPLNGVNIRGYFPNPHPDGPALARMKEVKL